MDEEDGFQLQYNILSQTADLKYSVLAFFLSVFRTEVFSAVSPWLLIFAHRDKVGGEHHYHRHHCRVFVMSLSVLSSHISYKQIK